MRVDGVARSARYVGDDVALFADEGIDQRGLTCVGSTHDGDTRSIEGFVYVFAFGEVLDDGIEEVARTATADGGDGHWVAEAKAVELGRLVVLGIVVSLIGYQEDGLLGAAELGRYLIIEVGDAALYIDDKEDDIGFLHGDLYLLVDFAFEDIFATYDPAASVDDGKFAVKPRDLAVLAVAGRPGLFADDGPTGLRHTVEEGGLPYVGTPYYCY